MKDFNNAKKRNLSYENIGKIPPQAIELEVAVLGACLLEAREIFNTVNEILHTECFYLEKHKIIYESMCYLWKSNNPIDILTVTQELRKTGKLESVGGVYTISTLTNTVSSSLNTEYHCKIILQKYMARELIRISSESINSAYEEETDIIDEIEKHQNKIGNIGGDIGGDNVQTLYQVGVNEIQRIRESISKDKKIGLPYPLNELNVQTGGMQEGEMIVLAGRPGMGKSAFALDIMYNLGKKGIPTVMYNLEMTNKETIRRVISKDTFIQINDIKSLKLSERDVYEITNSITSFKQLPIYLSDNPISTIPKLKRSARKIVREKGVKMIVLDYIQLMSDKTQGRNRENEVSEISRGIKLLAKELKIPIIALSQLSRNVEQRSGEKKPLLSDLRESGSIEQDADVVMFVYRPEFYGQDRIITNEGEISSNNKAFIDIAKNRNGGLCHVLANFNKITTTFTDIETQNNSNYAFNQAIKPSNEF